MKAKIQAEYASALQKIIRWLKIQAKKLGWRQANTEYAVRSVISGAVAATVAILATLWYLAR